MSEELWSALASLRILSNGNNQIPPYAARANTIQTIAPVSAAGHQRTTINGKRIALSEPQFKKFRSTITGDDIESAPTDDLIFPDAIVTVECSVKFKFRTGTGSQIRPAVEGSLYQDPDGFTYYRPVLEMMVEDTDIGRQRYRERHTWRIDLVEVEAVEVEQS
jgi:hypothetical protein